MLYDFESGGEGELNLAANETLTITDQVRYPKLEGLIKGSSNVHVFWKSFIKHVWFSYARSRKCSVLSAS